MHSVADYRPNANHELQPDLHDGFLRRLRAAIDKAGGVDALAAKTKLHPDGIKAFLAGTLAPNPQQVERIAMAAGTTRYQLITGHDEPEMMQIPLYAARAEAGHGGGQPEDWLESFLPISGDEIRELGLAQARRQIAGIRIRGDSMSPDLKSGDLVLIDTGDRQLSDGVFVIILGGEAMVKRIQVHMDGHVSVISDNEAYARHELKSEEADELIVVGRVVAHRAWKKEF